MRKLLAALLLAALTVPALAQIVSYPPTNRIVGAAASSGNVANATATATLAAGTQGETTYICGFAATGGGATAAATVNLTVTGALGGTLTYNFSVPTGIDAPAAPLVVSFAACLPAAAPNATIVVSMPALGAGGNAHAAVNAWGFRLAARD